MGRYKGVIVLNITSVLKWYQFRHSEISVWSLYRGYTITDRFIDTMWSLYRGFCFKYIDFKWMCSGIKFGAYDFSRRCGGR